jgi:STE24 endopeptidase
MNTVLVVTAILILIRWSAQILLERINTRHTLEHGMNPPPQLQGRLDSEKLGKAIDYTAAKSRLGIVDDTWSAIVLLVIVFSGVLPIAFREHLAFWGNSHWSQAGFLLAISMALSIPDLPIEWYDQFRLEERFGFNKMTLKLWIADHIKMLALGILLGYPLMTLILFLVGWAESSWWLWTWGVMLAFQLTMLVLAPILILPLFNKFSPLPDGELKQRLMDLAQRTGFHTSTIQLMDGSRRSAHSNAFFTGLGRFRKIVLFDTLVEQLSVDEMEAVLAHEIGHYKKKHIPRVLVFSAFGMLAGLFVLFMLSKADWFYHGFGFTRESLTPAFLMFSLLGGTVLFWIHPLTNFMSRRHEYEADAFAVQHVEEGADALSRALIKLHEENLSNPSPAPLYSRFYYSHPTLVERLSHLADFKPRNAASQ